MRPPRQSVSSATLGVAEDVRAAFSETVLHPSGLMCSASPRKNIDGACITRSLHFCVDRSFSLLQVRGLPRSKRVRQLAKVMRIAGYERWCAVDEELFMRRWLFGRADVVRESKLLLRVGDLGAPESWPERPRLLPRAAVKRRNPAYWTSALSVARTCGVPWDGLMIGCSAHVEIPVPTGGRLVLRVEGIGIAEASSAPRFTASIERLEDGGLAVATSLRALREVIRTLRAAGYRPRRGSRSADIKLLRSVETARQLAEVCQRTVSLLRRYSSDETIG